MKPIETNPMPRRFSAMAKPVGPACNLGCSYCYYLSKDKLLGLKGIEPIPDAILEKHIHDTITGNDSAEVIFDWQGGEPTLLGLDFFKKVLRLQAQATPPGKVVLNNLQTNGTLLDENWCRFLRENRFLVGLSIDGPKSLHDTYRLDKGGAPTFNRVMSSVKLLKKMGVEFNTLTVLNRQNVKYPLDVYRFLTREVGPRMIQFIPLVEPIGFEQTAPDHWDKTRLPVTGSSAARPGTPDSMVHDWSADPEELGAFLCKVFDEWYQRDIGKYFVNFFEGAVSVWSGLPAQTCVFSEICGKAVLLERDGSVYSCDHFAYPEYKLGTIQEQTLVDMIFSPRQARFGLEKRNTLPAYCRNCKVLFACWGECPKNRFVKTPDGEPGLNYFCPAFKRFFTHIDSRITALIGKLNVPSSRF
jgi:uncharacterized protein